jgi:2-polyprenyl-3-methyl-5-hydroxy-6-metoxy-1,4-benzoquinol methylase
MSTPEHWDEVYSTKPVDGVSWFRDHLETSLGLIQRWSAPGRVLDVGCGASTLAADLTGSGYRVTMLDISAAAIAVGCEPYRASLPGLD